MPSSDAYRRKALELYSLANNEGEPELSVEFQALAMAYIRLAERTDRKALFDPTKHMDEP